MKTNYPPLKSLLLLAMLTGVLSCNDHRIPNPTPGAGRLRVKSITQDLPDNKKTVSAFQYDGQGRLSMIIAYQTPDSSVATVEKSTYQYNAQGQLTEFRLRGLESGSRAELYVRGSTYHYDATGKVSGYGPLQITNSLFQLETILKYGSDNRVSGFVSTPPGGSNFASLQYREFGDFTYTGDNLTSDTFDGSYVRGATVRFGPVTTTYSYDTNINPFYGILDTPTPSGGYPLHLSKNNVLSAVTDSGQTTIYSYTYNAASLPTKRVTATGNSVTETLYFEYEPY